MAWWPGPERQRWSWRSEPRCSRRSRFRARRLASESKSESKAWSACPPPPLLRTPSLPRERVELPTSASSRTLRAHTPHPTPHTHGAQVRGPSTNPSANDAHKRVSVLFDNGVTMNVIVGSQIRAMDKVSRPRPAPASQPHSLTASLPSQAWLPAHSHCRSASVPPFSLLPCLSVMATAPSPTAEICDVTSRLEGRRRGFLRPGRRPPRARTPEATGTGSRVDL